MKEQERLIQKEKQGDREKTTNEVPNSCWNTRVKVLFYVMINSIALMISGSAQTQYIYEYVKRNDFPNASMLTNKSLFYSEGNSCPNTKSEDEKQIQAKSSDWSWYITLIEYGLATPVIFLVGPMSDKVGRKPVILWNLVLMVVSFAVKTVAVYFQMSLFIFMAGSAIEGLSGAFQTFHLANLSILADQTSTGKDRTIMMALYDALLGVGSFLSYAGAGYAIQLGGYWFPFAMSTGLFLFILLLVGFTLNDSRKPSKASDFTLATISTLFFSVYSKKNIKCSRYYIIMYLLIFLVSLLPLTSITNITTLYSLGFPYCWNAVHIGWYNAGSSLVVMVIGTAILKLVHICYSGSSDTILLILGYLSTIASFVVLGFAKKDDMIYAGMAAGVLRILPIPLIKAILSRAVLSTKQGALFSNIYLMEAVCLLFGSTIFNNIYHQTVSIYSGLTFFVMAGFPLLSIILLLLVIQLMDKPNTEQEIKVEQPPTDTHIIVESAHIQDDYHDGYQKF